MLVSATHPTYDRNSNHRPQFARSVYSSHVHTFQAKDHHDSMTLSTSQADTPLFAAEARPTTTTTTTTTTNSSPSMVASTSTAPDSLVQPVPTRPKNHVRGIASDSRIWTTARGFFEGRYQERQSYASIQEKKELEAERDAILQIQSAQAAKRRAKMMRLTPAFPALPRAHTHTPSPPSSEAFSARTASEADLATPPDNRLPFPSPKMPISMATSQNAAPIHPAFRKALALKANSPGPEVLGGLSLDLHCLPSPAGDRSSISSTNSELIRKKSGEPVKSSLKPYSGSYMYPRSASEAIVTTSAYGAKSVPTTPSAPKFVHFDKQLEHIKIFKVKGRPQAVSREGSPEHTETETEEERDYPWFGSRRGGGPGRAAGSRSPTNHPTTPDAVEADEQLVLRLPNFPSSAKLSLDKDIFLERIYLSDDLRSVRGTVQVKNLSFEKWVAVRFTLDHWVTVNEVSAEYSESIKQGTADRFVFSIKLNEVLNWPRGAGLNETKTIFLCLRYTTGGREIWDNNDGSNYQLDFRKRPAQPAEVPRMPPTSNESRGAAASFGNTVPRRYTLSSMGPASTSSIIEMGRRTGVYGQKATRDNAMERLKQELERLRSDDEEAEKAPPSCSFITEMSKRRSPPVSPGGAGKPSSPSLWGARYDFGASLRDPSSGSRKTEAGRAAALDYFSARPSPAASSSPVRSSFVVSAATPSPDGSTPRSAAELVPKFGRLGMLSPGLGDDVVEHAAVNSSTTSSPTGSLLQVPQVGANGASSPLSPVSPTPSSSTRFNSFPPPNRNAQPRSVFGIWHEEARNGSNPGSASGSASGSRSGTPPSPIGFSTTRIEIKGDGTVLEDYTLDGSQASPTSLNNSPNPFSPALSATSVDSDSTAMIDFSNEPGMSDSLDGLGSISGSSSYHYLRADHLEGRNRPSSFAAGDDAEQRGYSSSVLSLSTTLSPSSELATPDEEFMRPSNLTSFNELVARFCWNGDNQVPQASPDTTSLNTHTPSSASGRSTPIARAGGAY
ncbi:uncharacterized protein UHO2_00532 [Ustilago hordei]|uniref:uncharacterized protein n=1 Tax=Ustilago hordei TaxID=120017 RepID=UPI001A4A4FA2|nr:uncharacterized protein UHO2_00532 [Ustilago hordei]SYW82047.1 uncharacterized protein UHO2_00532 [Ustilago hordei]